MDRNLEFLSATLADVVECVMFLASAAREAGTLNRHDAKLLADRMKAIAARIEAGGQSDHPGSLATDLHSVALLLSAPKDGD